MSSRRNNYDSEEYSSDEEVNDGGNLIKGVINIVIPDGWSSYTVNYSRGEKASVEILSHPVNPFAINPNITPVPKNSAGWPVFNPQIPLSGNVIPQISPNGNILPQISPNGNIPKGPRGLPVFNPQIKKQPLPVSPRNDWFWKGDSGHWNAYNQKTSDFLDSAYYNNDLSAIVNAGMVEYEVHFTDPMIRTRVGNPNRARLVKKEERND